MKKLKYYANNLVKDILPKKLFEANLESKLRDISKFDKNYIEYRVNYYNKLSKPFTLTDPLNWKTFKKKPPSYRHR